MSASESIRLHRSRSERPLCARGRAGLRRAGLAIVCLLAWLPGTSLGAAEGGERLVESVAAQVGNEIVLQSEVMELAAPIEERMRQAGAPEAEIAMVRRQALERLIETKLLSSVVERLELSASREEVDEAIAAIAGENGLSVEQLHRHIIQVGVFLYFQLDELVRRQPAKLGYYGRSSDIDQIGAGARALGLYRQLHLG